MLFEVNSKKKKERKNITPGDGNQLWLHCYTFVAEGVACKICLITFLTGKQRSDAVRTEPILLDGQGLTFWKLTCFNDESNTLLQGKSFYTFNNYVTFIKKKLTPPL